MSFSSSNQVKLEYYGPAKGAFDAIAAQLDAAWEYDESKQRVNFYKFKTETFRIAAVQGQSGSKAELGANESKSSQGVRVSRYCQSVGHPRDQGWRHDLGGRRRRCQEVDVEGWCVLGEPSHRHHSGP